MSKDEILELLESIESDARSTIREIREGNYEAAERPIGFIKDYADDLPFTLEFKEDEDVQDY